MSLAEYLIRYPFADSSSCEHPRVQTTFTEQAVLPRGTPRKGVGIPHQAPYQTTNMMPWHNHNPGMLGKHTVVVN